LEQAKHEIEKLNAEKIELEATNTKHEKWIKRLKKKCCGALGLVA